MKKITPDEQFLIELYKLAMREGDPFQPVPIHLVATAIRQRETAVKNIVKHLAQANFLKKGEDDTVYLTPRGCDLVLDQ